MASEINVFGIDKLIGDLKAYSEKVEMGFNNAVKEAALNTETGAKMDCPVDMGILPNGYDEYALQFKGQKSVAGMNAQPYLIPNFEMQKEQLIAKIKILINNV